VRLKDPKRTPCSVGRPLVTQRLPVVNRSRAG
jgi:hypothetical protein